MNDKPIPPVAEPDVMGAYYQGRLDMMLSLTDVLHRDPSVLSHDWLRQGLVGAQTQLAQHRASLATRQSDDPAHSDGWQRPPHDSSTDSDGAAQS